MMVRRRSLGFVAVAALVPLVASGAFAASAQAAQRQGLHDGAATVKHIGPAWQASVHNPASGSVALRSGVTDSAGDRSVETVYRAYAVS